MSQDDITDPDDFTDQDYYMRVLKNRKIQTKNTGEAIMQYLNKIVEKISSDFAEIKAKLDQVGLEIEQNGQRLLEEFQKHSSDYENKLMNERMKLNKIFQEFYNYKTSHNEICQDEILKFQAQKQNIMAQFAELRKNDKDKLGTILHHIKEVNDGLKIRNEIENDDMFMVHVWAAMREDQTHQDPTTATTSTS